MREIELKPSRRLGLLLAGMIMLALLAIGLASLPPGIGPILGMAVLGAGVKSRRHVLQLPPRLRIVADGRLQAMEASGEWGDVEVRGDSFVSNVLIVLRYRCGQPPVRTLTLLPDSASADDLRRIRVSLRWKRRTCSGTSSPGAG